jgi:hypothetical protein
MAHWLGQSEAPAVARLYEAINAERVAVAAALGASVPNLADWFERVYGVRGATLVETCQRLTYNSDGPYQATGTPKSLDHKFITEDVPTGLIPMSEIGVAAGVKTPAIDALIEIVRNMTGKDFAAEGRTLERMGLGRYRRAPYPTRCGRRVQLAVHLTCSQNRAAITAAAAALAHGFAFAGVAAGIARRTGARSRRPVSGECRRHRARR